MKNSIIISIKESLFEISYKAKIKSYKMPFFLSTYCDYKILGKLIAKALNDDFPEEKNVSIITSEYFTEFRKEESIAVKKSADDTENTKDVNHINRSLNIFANSVYIFNGRLVKYSQIPVLSKYTKLNITYNWRYNGIENLTSEIKAIGYNLDLISPINYQYLSYNQNTKSGFTVFSLYENNSFVSYFNNGNLVNLEYKSYGYNDIIEMVSNKMKLPINASKILIEKYGFIYLPSQYSDYIIDYAESNSKTREIELPEISYCLRNSVKKYLENILGGDLDFYCNQFSIDKLFYNSDYFDSKIENLISNIYGLECIKQSFDLTNIFDISYLHAEKEIELPDPNIKVENDLDDNFDETSSSINGFTDKFKSFITKKILPLLMEG